MKYLKLAALIFLFLLLGAGAAVLFLSIFPQADDLRALVTAVLLITALAGGFYAGLLFSPRWLRAGAAACAMILLLIVLLLLSAAPFLLTPALLLLAAGAALPAALLGALGGSGWRLAEKMRLDTGIDGKKA